MSPWEESEELDKFLNEEREVFSAPKEWMRQTDKVVDAYKNEVDLLRGKVKDIGRKIAAITLRMQNLEVELDPIRKAVRERKETGGER